MTTMSVAEAKARLEELVEGIDAEGFVITSEDGRPVARLVGLTPEARLPMPGRCKGMLTVVAEDDEHLNDWAEYLP